MSRARDLRRAVVLAGLSLIVPFMQGALGRRGGLQAGSLGLQAREHGPGFPASVVREHI